MWLTDQSMFKAADHRKCPFLFLLPSFLLDLEVGSWPSKNRSVIGSSRYVHILHRMWRIYSINAGNRWNLLAFRPICCPFYVYIVFIRPHTPADRTHVSMVGGLFLIVKRYIFVQEMISRTDLLYNKSVLLSREIFEIVLYVNGVKSYEHV